MFHLMVVEDSEDFQKLISRTFASYKLTICGSFAEAVANLDKHKFDLVLVDIGLPDKSGYELINEVQSHKINSEIPVLCLTGRTNVTDKVTAFSLGADDYITKPFDPLELRARIDAKLKKALKSARDGEHLSVGDIDIDLARHRVQVRNVDSSQEAEVTQTEFKLLCAMARRPDQVFTRDQLLIAAWGEDARVLDRVVDVHICSLRKKLGHCSKYIKAVPGVGYRITLYASSPKMKAV